MHRPKISLIKKTTVLALIGALLFTSAALPLVAKASAMPGIPSELINSSNNSESPSGNLLDPDNAPPPGPSTDLLPSIDGLPLPNDYGVNGGTNNGASFSGNRSSSAQYNPGTLQDSQARSFVTGQTGAQGQTAGQATTDIAANGVSCSAGQILGQLLTSAISSAISSLINAVVGSVAQTAATTFITVPINTTFDTAGQQIIGDTRARSGGFTMFGIFINVSWDSIAWCVVNAMIEYIADATIAWANSGFNGNPAFLQNPERFFSDMADYSAGKIIKDIAYGATGGKLNICQPFRIQVAVGLARSYSGLNGDLNSRYRGMSCKLSDITQRNFFGGINVTTTASKGVSKGKATTWSDWLAVTQNDANNPYGAYILANDALYSSVSVQQNTLKFEVGLNNGWLNFKKCKNGEKDLTKCDTVTPGRLIESQLNQTLGLSKQRLVFANKFDQMITAIVNNLIKVALNKILN